ncbi:MAG: hypothetical protein AB7V32_06695 [Candidatus Berkiella sp.]
MSLDGRSTVVSLLESKEPNKWLQALEDPTLRELITTSDIASLLNRTESCAKLSWVVICTDSLLKSLGPAFVRKFLLQQKDKHKQDMPLTAMKLYRSFLGEDALKAFSAVIGSCNDPDTIQVVLEVVPYDDSLERITTVFASEQFCENMEYQFLRAILNRANSDRYTDILKTISKNHSLCCVVGYSSVFEKCFSNSDFRDYIITQPNFLSQIDFSRIKKLSRCKLESNEEKLIILLKTLCAMLSENPTYPWAIETIKSLFLSATEIARLLKREFNQVFEALRNAFEKDRSFAICVLKNPDILLFFIPTTQGILPYNHPLLDAKDFNDIALHHKDLERSHLANEYNALSLARNLASLTLATQIQDEVVVVEPPIAITWSLREPREVVTNQTPRREQHSKSVNRLE